MQISGDRAVQNHDLTGASSQTRSAFTLSWGHCGGGHTHSLLEQPLKEVLKGAMRPILKVEIHRADHHTLHDRA